MAAQEDVDAVVQAGDRQVAETSSVVGRYGGVGSSDPSLYDDLESYKAQWSHAKEKAESAASSWIPSFLSGMSDSFASLKAVYRAGSPLYARAVKLAADAGHPDAKRALAVSKVTMRPPMGGIVARVQTALNRLRTPPPNAPLVVDNVLGRETRKALSWFQSGHGLPVTASTDAATISALSVSSGEGPMSPGEVASIGFEWMLPAVGGAALSAAAITAYHAYKHMRGHHGPTAATPPGTATPPALGVGPAAVHGIDVFADLSRDPSAVARAQQELNQLGARLLVDGSLGHQTRGAIARFQAARNLTPTGNLDVVTSSILELAAVAPSGTPTFTGEDDEMGFEWTAYLLGLGTLPAAAAARGFLHNVTGGAPTARVYGEDDMGFEWVPYLLGVGTLPAISAGRTFLHNMTGGGAARYHGEAVGGDYYESLPWELESTPTEDLLFGDTMMSLPADNLGRMRF